MVELPLNHYLEAKRVGSMSETNDVFTDLTPQKIGAKEQECQPPSSKVEYTQAEVERFRQQSLEVEQTKANTLTLDSSQLLALACGQLQTNISLIEAGKILSSCGLPEVEQYTTQECDRFIEACILVKQQGKTYQEVAMHFGVAPGDNALIEEVHGLLGQVSSTQANLIRTALPKMAVEQLQEVKSLFWRMTARQLKKYVDSGQLETEIRTASENILATVGKYLGLLMPNSSPKVKSLPG